MQSPGGLLRAVSHPLHSAAVVDRFLATRK
jgi:hypothetical protein